MSSKTRLWYLKGLRSASIVGGGMMILFALLADKLGYGSSGSLGIGQILLMAIGLLVLLAGVLGRRFPRAYQNGATILLNTLVLLALIELAAIFFGRSLFRQTQSEIQTLSYYTAQDWATAYWQEVSQSQEVRYEPYVIWKMKPFSGEMVNFDQDGVRQTPGAECFPGSYRVFTFGGSTMLGWGSPDWGTIAAHLQSGLQKMLEQPVCIVNFGQDGYVSTQSLIKLMLELQQGNTPDAVIFYEGVNDVLAGHESQQPGTHVTLSKIAAIFEGQEHPLLKWVSGTRTFALLQNFAGRLALKPREGNQLAQRNSETLSNTGSLANSIAATYLANYQMVGILANEYGFDYFFFLQPHPAIGAKNLTQEELILLDGMDPELANLARSVYNAISLAAPENEGLWNLAGIFEQVEGLIWIDDVGHVTPEGNQMVAEAMLEAIRARLASY